MKRLLILGFFGLVFSVVIAVLIVVLLGISHDQDLWILGSRWAGIKVADIKIINQVLDAAGDKNLKNRPKSLIIVRPNVPEKLEKLKAWQHPDDLGTSKEKVLGCARPTRNDGNFRLMYFYIDSKKFKHLVRPNEQLTRLNNGLEVCLLYLAGQDGYITEASTNVEHTVGLIKLVSMIQLY